MALVLDENISAFPGWHDGVIKVQKELGFKEASKESYISITNFLPAQHRLFHSRNLFFLPVCTTDEEGRPWVGILTPPEGGFPTPPNVQEQREVTSPFIVSPTPRHLVIRAQTWEGDPTTSTIKNGEPLAGIGIELSTRRRNKFSGKVVGSWRRGEEETDDAPKEAGDLQIAVEVLEALGNCPKYITIHALEPYPRPNPKVIYNIPHHQPAARLPSDLVDFIHTQPAVYLGTAYRPSHENSNNLKFPLHNGVNHRGGRSGFCRVDSTISKVYLPDFSGNRFMTSLGTIEIYPYAGFTFPNFINGDILYLTGRAKNLFGKEADKIMPRVRCLTELEVTGYTFVRGAIPLREREGTNLLTSPYNPPIRYLATELEAQGHTASSLDGIKATLVDIELFSREEGQRLEDADLGRFTLELSKPIITKPGQYVVLDLTPFVGKGEYQHMARGDEQSLNDDGIRTWTISSASEYDPSIGECKPTTRITITMRSISNGRLTPEIFRHARQQLHRRNYSLGISLECEVIGIGGDFVLPTKPKKILGIAGGIGVTPLLSFLEALVSMDPLLSKGYDLLLLVATRDERPLMIWLEKIIKKPLEERDGELGFGLKIHTYTKKDFASNPFPNFIYQHDSRKSATLLNLDSPDGALEGGRSVIDLEEREIFLCGPVPFENEVMKILEAKGVGKQTRRENFNF